MHPDNFSKASPLVSVLTCVLARKSWGSSSVSNCSGWVSPTITFVSIRLTVDSAGDFELVGIALGVGDELSLLFGPSGGQPRQPNMTIARTSKHISKEALGRFISLLQFI